MIDWFAEENLPMWLIDPDNYPGPVCDNCFNNHHEYCWDLDMPTTLWGPVACGCTNMLCEEQ